METAPDKSADALTNKIHHTLAHSYFIYFLFLVLGVVLDFLFPLRVFKSTFAISFGLLFLALATALIFWAQRANRNLHKQEALTKEAFLCGPYCYTRTPTHWGLFVLTLGFGIVVNAFFVVLTTILSFLLTKFIFLRKYEDLLKEKYGDSYLEYMREVKL